MREKERCGQRLSTKFILLLVVFIHIGQQATLRFSGNDHAFLLRALISVSYGDVETPIYFRTWQIQTTGMAQCKDGSRTNAQLPLDCLNPPAFNNGTECCRMYLIPTWGFFPAFVPLLPAQNTPQLGAGWEPRPASIHWLYGTP